MLILFLLNTFFFAVIYAVKLQKWNLIFFFIFSNISFYYFLFCYFPLTKNYFHYVEKSSCLNFFCNFHLFLLLFRIKTCFWNYWKVSLVNSLSFASYYNYSINIGFKIINFTQRVSKRCILFVLTFSSIYFRIKIAERFKWLQLKCGYK